MPVFYGNCCSPSIFSIQFNLFADEHQNDFWIKIKKKRNWNSCNFITNTIVARISYLNILCCIETKIKMQGMNHEKKMARLLLICTMDWPSANTNNANLSTSISAFDFYHISLAKQQQQRKSTCTLFIVCCCLVTSPKTPSPFSHSHKTFFYLFLSPSRTYATTAHQRRSVKFSCLLLLLSFVVAQYTLCSLFETTLTHQPKKKNTTRENWRRKKHTTILLEFLLFVENYN